jgi:DUF1365 family protein
MHSAIYEGHVVHRRFAPVSNRFRYRLHMVYLDLAELDEVFRGRWLWSTRGWNLAYLRRRDHLGDPGVSMEQAVRDLVEERLGTRPVGPIRMLTHLRYWGYCFNPVSFFYCFDPSGERVTTIVAEVSNTPWNERHCYVLGPEADQGSGPWHVFHFPKAFHVSPFIDMAVEYTWRFREPGAVLQVHMLDRHRETGEPILLAGLQLSRREISTRSLARALVAYPFLTVQVILRIYWQALRLWRKGAPFHTHPSKRPSPEETS